MPDEHIAFRGSLRDLYDKVRSGEMIPKLQASHAPPCKFWTAFSVINGIRHTVPVIHGPRGCTYSVAYDFKMTACEYRGVPLEPTTCTALDETNVVYGGEGKLVEAIREADRKYNPDLIVVLSCCCSGIIGDDVETVAHEAEEEVGARVLAIRSEGFGGDFRSGYEDAFRVIMDLMEEPERTQEKTINILGARIGPTYTERNVDINELERVVAGIGARINAVIAGGCTVDEIRRAREVQLNASWCYDWGGKIGELIEQRYGIPYAKTGQPYGLKATEEWIMGVAGPLGLEEEARRFIATETASVAREAETIRSHLDGRTALVEVTDFPGPIRALALARMAEEFGARPVVVNVHPYTIKERMPSIEFLLESGQNPEVVLTTGIFRLGTYSSSFHTEMELERLAREYENPIYIGTPYRYPDCPVVNMTTMAGYPQYGYIGIRNLAQLISSAVEDYGRPRSRIFKRVFYGVP